MNKGSKQKPKWKAQPGQRCEGCSLDSKRQLGCGYDDRFRDKATLETADDESTWAVCKVCPEWLILSSPFINELYELLPHFKAGTLGNVLTLPMPLVEYLQALDDERGRFEAALYDKD